MSKYPEHDKLMAARDSGDLDAVTKFLEWLRSNRMVIADATIVAGLYCDTCDNETGSVHITDVTPWLDDREIRKTLGAYFNVDQRLLDEEKQMMLGIHIDQQRQREVVRRRKRAKEMK